MKIKKNLFYLIAIFAIIALDWAALDDITTGNEPNYFSEYATLALSIPILISLFIRLLRERTGK